MGQFKKKKKAYLSHVAAALQQIWNWFWEPEHHRPAAELTFVRGTFAQRRAARVFLQGSKCGCWAAPPPVSHPSSAAALSALPDLPQDAPLPQKQRLNTSGEPVFVFFCFCSIIHARLHQLPAARLWVGGLISTIACFLLCNYCRRADSGCFSVPSSRLSMRSETTRTRSCTCWLCRVSIPPGTPPPFEKATRFPSLLPLRPQTRWAAFIHLNSLFDPFSDASIASASFNGISFHLKLQIIFSPESFTVQCLLN